MLNLLGTQAYIYAVRGKFVHLHHVYDIDSHLKSLFPAAETSVIISSQTYRSSHKFSMAGFPKALEC